MKKAISGLHVGWARFASNFFSLISEIKRIWICFTCVSLFHYKISLLFFRFFSLIFASNFSLRFTWVIFASIFSFFFHFFSLFFSFFRFFSLFFAFFALNVSLHFEAKQSEAKFKSIFRFFHFFKTFFSLFFTFFAFFHFFPLNFRFASIFSLNFRFFYLHFRFRFLVFHIEVNHVKSGFFFASKRNKIFASISNFASEAKVRAHPTTKWINRPTRCICATLLGIFSSQ